MAEGDTRCAGAGRRDFDSLPDPRRHRRSPYRLGRQRRAASNCAETKRAAPPARRLSRAVQRSGQRAGLRSDRGVAGGKLIATGLLLAGRLVPDPGSWLAWIVVGLISGAVAARVVAGRGFGCIAGVVVGIAG